MAQCKNLNEVEQEFRTLKSSLDLRPHYHWIPKRIRAHIWVLRSVVLLRKIIFGNRSEQRKKNISFIITIIRTTKLLGLDLKEVFKILLTKGLTP